MDNPAQNEKVFSKWAIIPFFTYSLFLLIIIWPNNRVEIGFLATLVGFIITCVCWHFKEKNTVTNINKSTVRIDAIQNQKIHKQTGFQKFRKEVFLPILLFLGSILVFQALYVFTALSVDTNPISCTTVFDEKVCFGNANSVENLAKLFLNNSTIVLTSFFAVGVLYYHGCIIVLKSNASAIFDGSGKRTFIEDFIILLEVIILFFAASSIGSLPQFVLWILVLMVLDLGWVFSNLKETMQLTFHWIHFDFLILFFLITLSTSLTSDDSYRNEHLFVLIVLVARTILDYKLGWTNFWSKYKGEAAS